MKAARFNPDNVWCIHAPRTGRYWYVKCPSRSGAKIFLCGAQGPGVLPSEGPFEAWEIDEAEVPEGKLLTASFFPANDPRNWKQEAVNAGVIEEGGDD